MRQRPSKRITEQRNPASGLLDQQTTRGILGLINREDRTVAKAVARTLPQAARAVDLIVHAIEEGGRLIYLGAGTSGRLGALDAAECPPTFGTNRVRAIIAGGSRALLHAVEGAEDDVLAAARDLRRIGLRREDVVVGVSASGSTPYTIAGLRTARRMGAKTIAVTCNPASALEREADVAIVPVTGPEVVTGSTRMKAGTATKLVLNMLSTAAMVRLGRVLSGWMTSGRLTNQKLRERGLVALMAATGARRTRAQRVLEESGYNLSAAMLMIWNGISKDEALRKLVQAKNPAALLRAAWKEHSRRPRA